MAKTDHINPQYYRLTKNDSLVGFKRTTTEFLPVTANVWQLDEIDHDPDASIKLDTPPMGIANLRRADLKNRTERDCDVSQGGLEPGTKEI